MQKKKPPIFFRILKSLVRLFYGKCEVVGLEKLPTSDAVIIGNHSQMNGPIVAELFMPDNCYIWCNHEMMAIKEVPKYAFQDFWSRKPKWTHPFFKLLALVISPLCAYIFNNARTIPVYHDARVIHTFKQSVTYLQNGSNILIFPEMDTPKNNILFEFQESFPDIAKLYKKRTGKNLTFYPLYIAPALRKAYIGEGIEFDPENSTAEERKRIREHLADEITSIARALPEHTVVPYRNMPRKYYLKNTDITEKFS